MSPLQVRTLWLTAPPLAALVAYLIVLDFWLYARHGSEATISAVYGKLLWSWPPLAWLLGLVTGILAAHFMWGRDWTQLGRPEGPVADDPARRDDPEGPRDAVA